MNILFVCTGNTCRSPMAEAYLDSKTLENVNVKSKGISADGSAVSEKSVEAMRKIGIDISGLYSEQLDLGDIVWADKIICLSLSHKTVLRMYAKDEKITVLGDGIADPFGQGQEVYDECLSQIVAEIDELIAQGFFSEFQVVAMEREHIKEVAKLEKICFSEPWSENAILESFLAGTRFFVAIENGSVLGYVGISCILDEGYITNIAVFPEHRRKGVGKALIKRLFGLSRDEKLSFISLEVRESNEAAIALYQKFGFKIEGKRKRFYNNPKEDAFIMTKRFENNEDISY
ncbi:MAG: ribosomal-protein-alanine N-acetyltransferase [Ruminococcaceae bacterium]|nr:ribosomal-protein-alanine N-acetyltransferase [Oscillospiraceae bacterium]